jgi:hypothetical protein
MPLVYSRSVLSGPILCCAALLAAAPPALAAPPTPPASDGSSGSFNAQFGDGEYLDGFNVDNGQVHSGASGGFIAFTVPHKTVRYNGQTLNAYNFTDFNMQPSVRLTIYGSKPAVFLASQSITIAGQLTFLSGAGAAGAEAMQSGGGAGGGNGGGRGGGFGGASGGGETQGAFCTEGFGAGGGGGGGNYAAGAPGLPGWYPVDAANPRYAAAGPGGVKQSFLTLQGGGGSGAGGGSDFAGDYYALPGAQGGGAVVFGTSGSFTITSTGVINANGALGQTGGAEGSSGGGAGGDAWVIAAGGFTNNGSLTARGGAGGAETVTLNCAGTVSGPGANGGLGSGGVVKIDAPMIQNNGLIDVSQGGGGTAHGGFVGITGTVVKGSGTIVGRKGYKS